jgi:hypothetical protein
MSTIPDTSAIDLDETEVDESSVIETSADGAPKAAYTIYIYEGQETQIRNEIAKEVVRDYLAQRFPHLAGASFVEGARTEGGLVYRTIELAKQTYRKGTTVTAIEERIRGLPATSAPVAHSAHLLALLDAENITLAELRDPARTQAILIEINDAEQLLHRHTGFGTSRSRRQVPLDERIAQLPAIPQL